MSDEAREKWFPGVGGTELDLYGWERCSHEGIGLAGCRVCDPDKGRVASRYEFLLERVRAERDDAEERADRWLSALERATQDLEAVLEANADNRNDLREKVSFLSWSLQVRLEEDVAEFRREMP